MRINANSERVKTHPKPAISLLSPSFTPLPLVRSPKTVRFQFPSQASKVRDICSDLDKVGTAISLLRMRSTPDLGLPVSPRLYDAPISLSRRKKVHRAANRDDLYVRKQTLVLLHDFKPRQSNPLSSPSSSKHL